MPDYETILAVIETGIDADNRAFYAEALEELRRWKGGGGTIFAATTAEIIKLEYAIRFRPAWVRLSVALTSPSVADCGRQASGVPWHPVCRHDQYPQR
jgi:hypothetical protein